MKLENYILKNKIKESIAAHEFGILVMRHLSCFDLFKIKNKEDLNKCYIDIKFIFIFLKKNPHLVFTDYPDFEKIED